MTARSLLALPAILWLLLLSAPVHAQSHEREIGAYILRASVATTSAIARESAGNYGIDRESDRAILNVIVLRKGDSQQMPLPAKVTAHTMSLAGVKQEIALEEIEVNSRRSYTGTFKFLPREVLDFTITAQPAGGEQILEMQFRERIWKGS